MSSFLGLQWSDIFFYNSYNLFKQGWIKEKYTTIYQYYNWQKYREFKKYKLLIDID